ncbi:hypothetical protein B6U91_01035 [Candidatus Pacearchaeota archaeon ex4484_71]|nr:MAG: hypothetical protein B6U91_01035 [Candidatus Pacearchaeota archaeon ex4484_71]
MESLNEEFRRIYKHYHKSVVVREALNFFSWGYYKHYIRYLEKEYVEKKRKTFLKGLEKISSSAE